MKDRLPSIAMIEPVGAHGGMDYYNHGLCQGLSRHDMNVTLYTSEDSPIYTDASYHIEYPFRGVYGKKVTLIKSSLFILAIVKCLIAAAIKRQTITHYHFFQLGLPEFMMLVFARLVGRKVVATIHDIESLAYEGKRSSFIQDMILESIDRIIVHNTSSREELTKRGIARPEKIEVIRHGNYLDVANSNINQLQAQRKLGLPDSKKYLLFFGQIKEVKGLDILIQAMALVRQKNEHIHLMIAGRPWKTDYRKYQKLIHDSGISDICHEFIGYVKNEEVPLYFAACDVVVLPYRKIYQSGVVLMAMSYGKAVLASDIPGMKDMIIDGDTGMLFKSGDVEDLANKICGLMQNDEKIKRISASGKQYVIKEHNWDTIAVNTKTIYSGLLKATHEQI